MHEFSLMASVMDITQEELTRQLQLAVNAEDYEHAAEIRDRLRALLGKEEA